EGEPAATPAETAPDRAFPELGKKDMPLSAFVPAFRRFLGESGFPTIAIADELAALATLVPEQKKKCAEARGRFREARWADAEHLSLFSCEVDDGKAHGLGARLKSDGMQFFPALSLYAEDANSGIGVELELNLGQQK